MNAEKLAELFNRANQTHGGRVKLISSIASAFNIIKECPVEMMEQALVAEASNPSESPTILVELKDKLPEVVYESLLDENKKNRANAMTMFKEVLELKKSGAIPTTPIEEIGDRGL